MGQRSGGEDGRERKRVIKVEAETSGPGALSRSVLACVCVFETRA